MSYAKYNLCWKFPQASKLIKLTNDAFSDFVSSGFDKTSLAWEKYRIARNKANNAVRDEKKKAMNAVLNDDSFDQWQKIKVFQGKNQQCNNFIHEIDYSDTKYTTIVHRELTKGREPLNNSHHH